MSNLSMSVRLFVCLSVCLSVCQSSRASQKSHSQTTKFLCMLPVAVARASSDGVAICYALPVLWMTSCFCVMGL